MLSAFPQYSFQIFNMWLTELQYVSVKGHVLADRLYDGFTYGYGT